MMRRGFLSSLVASALVLSAVGVAAAQDEELRMGDGPAYLERVEVPEAGVSMLLPPDWVLEIRMEESEFQLPDEYAAAAPATFVDAFTAGAGEDEWCLLKIYVDNPMPLEEHVAWDEASWAAAFPERLSTEVSRRDLWAETGYVLEMRIRSADGGVNVYMFESGGTRYEVQCASTFSVSDAWDTIAGSVEALDGDGRSDLERHEVPEAGIAISFSPEWLVETGSDELDGTLPPEYGDAATVPVIRVVTASLAGEAYCAAYYFDEHPLSTAEHADWYDSVASDNGAATEIELVSLPVGDAARVIEEHETGDVVATYLFDLDGVRHQLACASGSPPDDLWRSLAETIEPLEVEPLEEVPPGVPDEAVAWDGVVDFWTQFPVADPAEDAWLMSAWCDRALWVELPDGSFTERLECQLTEDPVEPAEWQGSWPAETVTLGGGACVWASDFWAEYDGSEIWASSWSAVVEPDGQVVAVLTYAPELLECADG